MYNAVTVSPKLLNSQIQQLSTADGAGTSHAAGPCSTNYGLQAESPMLVERVLQYEVRATFTLVVTAAL
jgi:hypothetical protein